MWWLVKNYLQVNKSNIQLFLVLFWYLETGQEIHQLKKIQWNNHKGKSKYYLFIIILFRHGLSVFFYNSKLGPHLLPLRVPHRHIRFCLFHESSNMAHEIHFPTEFSSNPNQTHPSMLINFFRIFRKPQVGELDQGWS